MAHITQRDNQSLGMLGGLYWDGQQFGPIDTAQDYDTAEDAAEDVVRIAEKGIADVDSLMVVE